MKVRVSTITLQRIVAHAATADDREICGLLFGTDDMIAAASPAANVAAAADRQFEIDPQALFAAIRAERHGGPRLIGHYHSHPSGSTVPSACDALAAEPGRLWLIVAGGHVAAWRAGASGAIHGVFSPVELAIAA